MAESYESIAKNYPPENYNKKETYTYDEVRPLFEAAMADRARYLGFFYKVMPRDLFDKYAKEALFEYGKFRVSGLGCAADSVGDPAGMAKFLCGCNSVANTLAIGNKVVAQDENHAVVRMEGKCALVQGWEQMGLSPEEVDYLCQIACYGDYGHVAALNLKGTWLSRSAVPGEDYCDFDIEKIQK